MGPGIFDWIAPIAKTKERDFVDKVGLDAAVFMRAVRMLRNIFTGQPWHTDALWSIGWSLLLLAIFFPIAISLYKKRTTE